MKEYQQPVTKLFEQAKISVFSTIDAVGFKEDKSLSLADEWFAAGTDHFDSIVLFSFTAENNAGVALELVKDYNRSEALEFPLRAFIVPVESAIW